TSDTYYTVNGGAATYSTIGTETATSAGLEIIFTGDLEFKTPQSGYWGNNLYIGNYQIRVRGADFPETSNNKERNVIYYSNSNYDNGNLYYWFDREWNNMDSVTLKGVSYGGYNNNRPYFTYALENLIYVYESETTINVTDSAGEGQIWYYKGDYYVQTRSNGDLGNSTIQDIFESNNYYHPYVKKLYLWKSY
ncbi:MAG: hypothetical protein K6B41_01360, partial [Butyrivibrio sp.]|nr:hypothetical protein [Butyrivibrio sp.]